MIVFDLKCRQDHRFQGWFRNGDTYAAQVAAGEVACPVCGGTEVEKAPMAPRLLKSRGEPAPAAAPGNVPDQPAPERRADVTAEVRRVLTELRRRVEESCDYVGERFSEEARRIHYGETGARPIYGEASAQQAEELREEGIEVAAIPWLPRSDA
jgi:hypothetical protein